MAPALQRMLSTLGLTWTFHVLAGIFVTNSLMAAMYRGTSVIKENGGHMKITVENTAERPLDVLRNGAFVTFMLSSVLLHMGYTVTFFHVVNTPLSSIADNKHKKVL